MTRAVTDLRKRLPQLEARLAIAFAWRNHMEPAWHYGMWTRRTDAVRCRARRLARLLRRVTTLPADA